MEVRKGTAATACAINVTAEVREPQVQNGEDGAGLDALAPQ
jgi:hypothetical protein